MPDFNITTPDGKKYKVTAPSGATQEQVLAYAQKHHEDKAPDKSSIDAAVPTVPSSLTGDASTMKNIGKDEPGYEYGDILPFKKNIKTGESSLALPEAVRAPIRGVGDLISQAQNKSTEGTPDAIAAMTAMVPGAKPAAKVATKAAEVIGEKTVSGIKSGAERAKESVSDISTGFKAREKEARDIAASNMKRDSGATFKKARAAGISAPPEIAGKLVSHVENTVAETGKNDPNLHGGTMQILSDMKEASKKGFTLEDADIYRRRLREIANKGGEDGHKASAAIDAIDESLENTKGNEVWTQARNQWAKARKFETISDALEKAGGDTNKIKSQLTKVLDSRKLTRGMNEDELAALKNAAKYSTPEWLARMAGVFGFNLNKGISSPGTAIPGAELLYGGAAHNPAVLPVVIGATGARYLGNLAAKGKGEKLLQTIERGKTANEAIGAESSPL